MAPPDVVTFRNVSKAFGRGATHLGILVAKARKQQLERARFPGEVQAFEGFAPHFRAV